MSTQSQTFLNQVSLPWLLDQKHLHHKPITMLTAYDYPTAKLLDSAGIDLILVGDSVATVLYGEPDTLSVDLETMLRHSQAVTKACTRAFVIGDMPFLSYQCSIEKAVYNAGRFLKEARTKAVKLEGGLEFKDTVAAITRAGIPVMGHIGLTPQSVHIHGGYRTHGKTEIEKQYLLNSASALEKAGAFAIVLECVEKSLAAEITKSISIPTIGIGSGTQCDGQVLVTQDLVGLTLGHVPKFVKPETNLKDEYLRAIIRYIERTKNISKESINHDLTQ